MSKEKTHDLYNFMQQISKDMAADYKRIYRQSTKDSATVGNQGEKNWMELLREWLPRTYKVVTKGQIISQDGCVSPLVDVLVLKDIYPEKLISKELYLAAGVAAAFECRATLEAEHIEKAMKTCAEIKNLYPKREGTPYKELHTPIVYGLLAHSYSWEGTNSTPEVNIKNKLLESDQSHVSHPRECLDILCVADLATWISCKMTFVGPRVNPNYKSSPFSVYEPKGAALSSYVGYTTSSDGKVNDSNSILPKIITGSGPPPSPGSQVEHFTPIGALISKLTRQLAWEDSALCDLADYYQSTNISGIGEGDFRPWSKSIYSKTVRRRAENGHLTRGKAAFWDEWRSFFY